MWVDEIVEETRRAREEYAARFDYDIAAIVADAREKEKQSERPVVSLPQSRRVENRWQRLLRQPGRIDQVVRLWPGSILTASTGICTITR